MIHRDVEAEIIANLKRKEITMLVGARQVGKTTLLKKLMKALNRQGKKVLFFNLDIENDARFLVSQQSLLNKIQLEFGNNAGYVIIDEIQQKTDAGKFLKGLFDMDLPYKFIVTGSGSLELKEKIGESLTGRKHLIEMNTVTFKEFLDYKTNYKYSDRLDSYCRIETENLYLLLNEYLLFGGYPKVITSGGIALKKEVMDEIFTSYITKDITYLLGLRSPEKFTKFIRILSVQSGKIINFSKLASDVGTSHDTLKDYFWYAQQTFVIRRITPYFTNPKKELTKSPTVYFRDLGMCNYACGRIGIFNMENQGFIFQNFIYLLLREKVTHSFSTINYWRTKDKAEVDFIIQVNGNPTPVEVKYSHLKNSTISRSYRSFINKYKPETGYIINLSLDRTVTIDTTQVQFIPFWKVIFGDTINILQ